MSLLTSKICNCDTLKQLVYFVGETFTLPLPELAVGEKIISGSLILKALKYFHISPFLLYLNTYVMGL